MGPVTPDGNGPRGCISPSPHHLAWASGLPVSVQPHYLRGQGHLKPIVRQGWQHFFHPPVSGGAHRETALESHRLPSRFQGSTFSVGLGRLCGFSRRAYQSHNLDMRRGEEANWLFSVKGIDIEIEKPRFFHRSWKTAPGL